LIKKKHCSKYFNSESSLLLKWQEQGNKLKCSVNQEEEKTMSKNCAQVFIL